MIENSFLLSGLIVELVGFIILAFQSRAAMRLDTAWENYLSSVRNFQNDLVVQIPSLVESIGSLERIAAKTIRDINSESFDAPAAALEKVKQSSLTVAEVLEESAQQHTRKVPQLRSNNEALVKNMQAMEGSVNEAWKVLLKRSSVGILIVVAGAFLQIIGLSWIISS